MALTRFLGPVQSDNGFIGPIDAVRTDLGWVDVGQFGIAGETDETEKFETLRLHAIANPGTTYRFHDDVEYQYTTPRWLDSVQDVTIQAGSALFKNLGANLYGYADMDAAVYLGSGSIFHDSQGVGSDPVAERQVNPANVNNGTLLTSAVARGATVIPVTSVAGFAVGNRVLLHWFSRQGSAGFPPNPGYFEYNEVSAVGASDVTLKFPTKYPYKIVAPDDTGNPVYYASICGKARLLNLDRTNYKMAGTIRWFGGIGVNTGFASSAPYDGVLEIAGASNVYVEGARFEGLFPTMMQNLVVRRSAFTGSDSELDKIIESVDIDDHTVIHNLSQGTGVQSFRMGTGKLYGTAGLRVRKGVFQGTTIASNAASGSNRTQLVVDSYPRDLLSFEKCHFYPDANQSAAVQPGNAFAATPDSVTTTTMVFNSGNAAMASLKIGIDYGQVISLNTGAGEEFFYVGDGDDAIVWDSSNNLTLTGTYNVAAPEGLGGTPAVARNVWNCKVAIWGPDNVIHGAPIPFDEFLTGKRAWSSIREGNSQRLFRQSFYFRAGRNRTACINAYITNITVHVSKAYSGSDATATLALSNAGLGGAFTYMQVNCKTAGVRRLDNFSCFGFQTGDLENGGTALDTDSRITEGLWCEEMALTHQGTGGTGLYTDAAADKLPWIRVDVEGLKP